jgi:hypothetical protein
MKKGKWMRFSMGLYLLLSLLILPGSQAKHCWTCNELAGEVGYLEIHNNTPYNIAVKIYNAAGYFRGVYTIKANPPFILTPELDSGEHVVWVYILSLVDQSPIPYTVITTQVPKNWETQVVTITTPTNYIPKAKAN